MLPKQSTCLTHPPKPPKLAGRLFDIPINYSLRCLGFVAISDVWTQYIGLIGCVNTKYCACVKIELIGLFRFIDSGRNFVKNDAVGRRTSLEILVVELAWH